MLMLKKTVLTIINILQPCRYCDLIINLPCQSVGHYNRSSDYIVSMRPLDPSLHTQQTNKNSRAETVKTRWQ